MSELYHERQSLQLCALHCVNNLLQAKAYTKKEFDNICYELTPVSFRNPHRSMLYDLTKQLLPSFYWG